MTRPGTFERVYSAIRERLAGGVFKPGERLEPALLSGELNSSVTPVRDALHRLTGERLVEAPRNNGFRAPVLTETMLRQMYSWHLDLLLLALASRARSSAKPPAIGLRPEDVPQHVKMNALFLELAAGSGNPEHSIAMASLAGRLGSVQAVESVLLDAIELETDAIVEAVRSGDRTALRQSLTRYHRRRQRIVPVLLELLRKG
jgi:DNA-binding GntR family transcriptional regulator